MKYKKAFTFIDKEKALLHVYTRHDPRYLFLYSSPTGKQKQSTEMIRCQTDDMTNANIYRSSLLSESFKDKNLVIMQFLGSNI